MYMKIIRIQLDYIVNSISQEVYRMLSSYYRKLLENYYEY